MATHPKWIPIGSGNIEPHNYQYPKLTAIDKVGGINCPVCHLTFGNKKDYDSHYLRHNTGSADIIYTCVICHKDIVGYPSFRGHCYLAHVVKDKFKCAHCDKLFSKQSILDAHINCVHKTIIPCSFCKKTFKCQKELLLHQMIHKNTDNGPPYKCHICENKIETSDDCEGHIEDHCTITYSCPICSEDITDLKYATEHLTKHFGEVNKKESDEEASKYIEMSNDCWLELVGGIMCPYCDSIHSTKQDFHSHIVQDHPNEDIIYACNICGKEFEQYSKLAYHGYNHTHKDKFECEECFKSFPRLSLLVIHMEAFHSGTKPQSKHPFPCLHCSSGFPSDRRLKEHYRSKHNIYYSQCSEPGCGKTFSTPKDLVFHLKEHNSAQNWCKQCGLRFYSLQSCENHLQYHKKKVYSCPICSKTYGEKHRLLKHLPPHFSTVLHVCKVCGKIYNKKNRFMEHLKVHTEEKPHVCETCGKGFTKIYLLKQHMNIHSGTKPFKCTNCPKTFASYPNMQKHQRKIHNVIVTKKKMLSNENIHSTSDIGKDNETSLNSEMSDETSYTQDILNNSGNLQYNSENLQNDSEDLQYNSENLQNNSEDLQYNSENLQNNTEDLQYNSDNLQNNSEDLQYNSEDIQITNTFSDMSDTAHSFEKPNESDNQWILDVVDPIALEMLEERLKIPQGIGVGAVANINDLQKDLWTSSTMHFDAGSELVPHEYGPEFVSGAEAAGVGEGVISLDDAPLPHIDPRLTLLHPPAPQPPAPIPAPAPNPDPTPKWEPPILTKLDIYDFDIAAWDEIVM